MSTHGDDHRDDRDGRARQDGEHQAPPAGDERAEPAAGSTTTFSAVAAETTHLGAAPAGEDAGAGGLSRETQDSIEALPPGAALLAVESGANAGARFLLDAAITTAGRHPGSDIFLDDVTVSRRHAEFARQGSGFVVRDAGSLNGTYVERERVDTHVLLPGEHVQIGKYRLTYHPHRSSP